MAEIWLMRHGAYAGHRPGYHAPPAAPLTQDGRAQIRAAASALPEHIAGIVTSPLLRAQQSATEIAATTGLPVLAVSDLLAEWRAPSAVLGQTPEAYPEGYRAWRLRRRFEPESAYQDGESLADLHRRSRRCSELLQTLTKANGTLLIVSHKILLGILTRPHGGPETFDRAALATWPFAQLRSQHIDTITTEAAVIREVSRSSDGP